MASTTQTLDELKSHLDDHLAFLRSSADAFDSGFGGEVKRLAVSLRVLLHDTKASHSLLGQLSRLGDKLISTTIPVQPGNVATHDGLIMTAMSRKGSTYFAPLDRAVLTRWLSFDQWWNEIVFVDDQKATLTRRELVLAVANQDGGAHVDPELSDRYARLSRHNSLGWVSTNPNVPPTPNPERAAIRQIAHEVLKTLVPGYGKTLEKPSCELIVGSVMAFDSPTVPPLQRSDRFGRNEQCPCGSGKKYKKCHGAI